MKEGLGGVPPADQYLDYQEDLLLGVALGPGQDPDPEQVGHLDGLGERLPGKVVEGHHRLGKALSQGVLGWLGEGHGRRGVP